MGFTWTAIHWLHLVAMAFFVGGQIVLAAVIVPALRGEQARPALRAIARGFGVGTLVAIAVLLATGAAMASHYQLWSEATLHIKLTLVAAVGALVLWHTRRPDLHVLEGLIFLGSLAIVWLGLALAH